MSKAFINNRYPQLHFTHNVFVTTLL